MKDTWIASASDNFVSSQDNVSGVQTNGYCQPGVPELNCIDRERLDSATRYRHSLPPSAQLQETTPIVQPSSWRSSTESSKFSYSQQLRKTFSKEDVPKVSTNPFPQPTASKLNHAAVTPPGFAIPQSDSLPPTAPKLNYAAVIPQSNSLLTTAPKLNYAAAIPPGSTIPQSVSLPPSGIDLSNRSLYRWIRGIFSKADISSKDTDAELSRDNITPTTLSTNPIYQPSAVPPGFKIPQSVSLPLTTPKLNHAAVTPPGFTIPQSDSLPPTAPKLNYAAVIPQSISLLPTAPKLNYAAVIPPGSTIPQSVSLPSGIDLSNRSLYRWIRGIFSKADISSKDTDAELSRDNITPTTLSTNPIYQPSAVVLVDYAVVIAPGTTLPHSVLLTPTAPLQVVHPILRQPRQNYISNEDIPTNSVDHRFHLNQYSSEQAIKKFETVYVPLSHSCASNKQHLFVAADPLPEQNVSNSQNKRDTDYMETGIQLFECCVALGDLICICVKCSKD